MLAGGAGKDVLNGGGGVRINSYGDLEDDHFFFEHRGYANADSVTGLYYNPIYANPEEAPPQAKFFLDDQLDKGLRGEVQGGIVGLGTHDPNYNSYSRPLHFSSFFRGRGLNGGLIGDRSGIYVDTSNGAVHYNDSEASGSHLIFTLAKEDAARLYHVDFEVQGWLA